MTHEITFRKTALPSSSKVALRTLIAGPSRWLLSLLLWILIGPILGSIEAHAEGSCIPDLTQPDIVLIMLDDLDYTDIGAFQDLFAGAYGNLAIDTPVIDQLADDGLSFTQYYAMGPVCSPTRASILSGDSPGHLGVRGGVVAGSFRGLPYDLITLPEMLQDACYTTLHAGKWHLGFQKPGFLPTELGFDHSVRRIGGSYESYEISVDDQTPVTYSVSNGDPHHTEFITDRAIELLQAAPADRPLFLNMWYFAPHGPVQPPAGFCAHQPQDPPTEQDRLELFACLVEYADLQIGRLLDEIDQGTRGRGRNTLVIFTSDNGGTLNNHHTDARRYLNGYKAQVFEGGIRVPMIARWQDGLAAAVGETNTSQVTSFDLYPTFADIVDSGKVDSRVEGQSFLDMLETGIERDRPLGSRWLYWETKRSNFLATPIPDFWNTFAVRKKRFKYVYQDGVEHFFDIEGDATVNPPIPPDPQEEVNVFAAYETTKVPQFRAKYFDWRVGSDISYPPPSLTGNVSLAGDVLTFFDDGVQRGGHAEIGGLANDTSAVVDPRFDFHDGDFSFFTRINIDSSLTGKGVIARKQDAWRLFVDDQGILKLIVIGGPTDDLTLVGPAVLASTHALAKGQEIHVGFTVFGLRKGPSVIRLYVDGALVASSISDIKTVQPSEEVVRLGENASSTAPFLGTIELPRLSVNSFYPCEVSADFQGVPASQVCLVPDP